MLWLLIVCWGILPLAYGIGWLIWKRISRSRSLTTEEQKRVQEEVSYADWHLTYHGHLPK